MTTMHNTVLAMFSWRESFLIFVLVFAVSVMAAVAVLVVRFLTRKPSAQPPVAPSAGGTRVLPTRQCPQCGAGLNPGTPEDLCPACLLRRGIATDAAPAGQPPFTPPPFGELARLFPQLEIIELIGKGGMGAVYKARQAALDRFVALKILAPRSGNDVDFASRFTREARALAKLSHPNIVGVYDFGQTEGLSYFIMEYVDGPNLRQVQHAGKLAPREALSVIPQICTALQFAHDEGIVHRDIKPENVLLDKKGRVKIADFGLAKILGQEPADLRLTGARDIMGTPHYMAPEQVEKPQDVDHRADIYSLGVVFYEMLTGELPLGQFLPPSSRMGGMQIDVRLDEVVLRTLAKEPERRYQQAGHLKTDVETIATGAPPAGTPSGTGPKINWIPALVFYCLYNLVWVAVGEATFHKPGFDESWPALAVMLPVMVLTIVFWAVLHYRCWKALPERFRATTPGKAIGLLFVPLFNFYWAFVSFPKLADGFNAARAERPELPLANLKLLGIGNAISFVCCWVFGWIPVLGTVVWIVDLVLFVLYYRGIVANANLLMESGPQNVAPEKTAAVPAAAL